MRRTSEVALESVAQAVFVVFHKETVALFLTLA
jgi:hypothetical protein